MAAALTPPAESLAACEQRWQRLIEGIRRRDERSLASLYDETSPVLFGLAGRILKDPQAAEDVVVAVFEQIWRAPDCLKNQGAAVLTALVLLTRSRAIERLRTQSNQVPANVTHTSDSRQIASNQVDWFAEEHGTALQELNGLPAEQRTAVEAVFFGGASDEELAASLRLSVDEVKPRVRVAFRGLREALRPGLRTGTNS